MEAFKQRLEWSQNPVTENPVLTPAENALLIANNLDPAEFGVIAGLAQVDAQRPMGLGPVGTPDGAVECLIVPLLLVIPASTFRPASRLADASGNQRSPAEGMFPVFATRALVPLVRLAERPRPTLVVPNGDFPEGS